MGADDLLSFLYASRFGRGVSLQIEAQGPVYDCTAGEGIPFVDATAAISTDEREIALFLVNRSESQERSCAVRLAESARHRLIEWVSLCGFPPDAADTVSSAPVLPKSLTGAALAGSELALALPAFSWNMLRIEVRAQQGRLG